MLAQFGLEPHAELTRLNIPTIWSHVAETDRPVVEQIVLQQVFGRPFVLPPGTVAAQVSALRQAFAATMQDPAFMRDLDGMKLDHNWLDGDRVSALVNRMYGAPKDVTERMAKALKPSGS